MMRLPRLLQLLDLRRTTRIEREAQHLLRSSRQVVRQTQDLTIAVGDAVASIRGIQANLQSASECLATGRTTEAKQIVDALGAVIDDAMRRAS